MKLPQLWSADLNGVIRWVQEYLAQQTLAATTDEVGAPVSSESTGMTRVWLGPAVPAGWLALDNSYVFISEAQDLYTLLGSAPGMPPAGMFRLPPAPTALASGQWIVKK